MNNQDTQRTLKYVEPPMHFCERCLDTGEILSGEGGPSWKHFEPCPECDGPPYGKKVSIKRKLVVGSHPSRQKPKNPDFHGKHVGYWYHPKRNPDLPHPQDFVDKTWDPAERQKVIRYLRRGKIKHSWRGYAPCRICDKITNGTTCLTDGTYTWPEGYAHYLEDHDVKPPAEFLDHVRQQLGPLQT